MNLTGKLKDLMRLAGGEWVVSFTTRDDPGKLFYSMTDEPVTVEIKKASGKRTKTMNDFCWAMCTDIGNALKPPLPKEEVYRKAIRDVGVFKRAPVRPELVNDWCEIWGSRGVGWFAEVVDDVMLEGHLYKLVFFYCGTSTYNTRDMSRVIDYLKQDMINMELPIPISREEEARLMANWQKASCSKTNDATCAAG
jgi:hypothetical protein